MVLIYAAARALGLADMGLKVDLMERTIRRGSGGQTELADKLGQEDRGEFPWRMKQQTNKGGTHDKQPFNRLEARCSTSEHLGALGGRTHGPGRKPWLQAIDVLQDAFTGPIARGLSLIAVVVGGLMFAFGEGGSKKALAGIIFGLGMAMGAANFLAWLF